MTATRRLIAAMCFCLMLVSARSAMAQNWAQWRGPLCSGEAPNCDPPTTWSESSNVRWKVQLPGNGVSTPIIWDNFVFIQTAIPTGKQGEAPAAQPAPAANPPTPPGRGPGGPGGPRAPGGGRRGGGGFSAPKPTEIYQFVLICIDRQTGKTLWQKVAREAVPHEGHHRSDGSYASASPITDGKHVWAFFGSRGLHCFDMQGNLLWSQDFGQMRIVMSFGEGSSPALAGDAIIVNWDHEGDCFTIAVDKNTGKTLWKVAREERSSWATPLVVEVGGKKQVITAASSKVRSYDPETGKLIWQCGGLTRNVIPCPVAADGMLYATSGYQGNALLAIRLGKEGDLTGTDAIAWTYNKNTPYVPSPLLYGGKLYLFASNNATMTCFESKTGKVLIDAQKLDELQGVYASPVGAAGRVYIVGRNGTAAVIKNSGKFELLATNRLDDKIDASPAMVGKELFLRGHQFLYCIAEK